MDYFRIRIPPPEPNFKFRFLEYELFSMIELLLFFTFGRQIVMQLNPTATSVKEFLGVSGKNGMLSFHFICAATGAMISSFTDVDGEHPEWLKRNHLRSSQMKTIPEGIFSVASRAMAEGFKSNQRAYALGKKSKPARKEKNGDCSGLRCVPLIALDTRGVADSSRRFAGVP